MISACRDVLEVDTAADVGKRVVAVVESISAVKTQLYTLYNRMYLKTIHLTFDYNFRKCRLISKILPLTDCQRN